MSAAPAALAGISDRAGVLAAGREASFAILNTEAEWTVTADQLHTRHAVSPYVGRRLTGRVQATYLRGACVWSRREREPLPASRAEDAFEETPRGREITLC